MVCRKALTMVSFFMQFLRSLWHEKFTLKSAILWDNKLPHIFVELDGVFDVWDYVFGIWDCLFGIWDGKLGIKGISIWSLSCSF